MSAVAHGEDGLLTAITQSVERARTLHPPGHRLRVLVLFDPDARVCRSIAAGGDEVACCPDRQWGTANDVGHATVLCEDADALLHSDTRWDLVVAADGWRRFVDVHSPESTDAILQWVRTHAGLAVVEAPRRVLAWDLNQLGPFDVQRILGGFAFLAEPAVVDGGGELRTPLLLASDQHLLVGEEWFAADDLTRLDADEAGAPARTVRTLRAPGGRIVKVECTSEEYFERSQVLAEAVFLERAGADAGARLGLPRVHAFARGRAVMALVRDEVPGTPAPAVSPSRATDLMAAVLDRAAGYAAEGLFHNDLRPWNVLWDGSHARFVDFADSSDRDDDVRDLPQVLALAGTLAALATAEIGAGEQFHGDVLGVAERAGALDRWPLPAQFTGPWLALPHVRASIRVDARMSAGDIVSAVLAATVGEGRRG